MRKHLIIVARRPGRVPAAGNLGATARNTLVRINGILNCRILQETPDEATLTFETERPDRPIELDATLKERGLTLRYAELCDWLS